MANTIIGDTNLIANSEEVKTVGSSSSSGSEAVIITNLYADLIANETYTFHCQTDGIWGDTGDTVECYLFLDKSYSAIIHMGTNPTTFKVVKSGAYYIRIDSNNGYQHKFWNFQIEEGTEATDWVAKGSLDGIQISIPTFGWSFNPIIADCVNPNNVKINAVLGEIVELEGDYYTLTSTDASTGYPSFRYGYYDHNVNFVSDINYRTYFINVSLTKGLKMRYVGLVDRDLLFVTHKGTVWNTIKLSASTSNPITNYDLTLPEGTTMVTVTTRDTVPFILYIGTFEPTQASSDLSVQISRIGYNGKTKFDLSGLSRMLFNRDEFSKVEKVDNVLYKNLRVSFSYDYTNIVNNITSKIIIGSANIGVIWGGLQIGETFNQNRTYRYFKGYPFTIPLYLDEKLVLKINDIESETLNAGKYNLDITEDSIVSLFNEYSRKIFTTVFDKTFQPQRILIGTGIEINIEVCDCNLGDIYLRWINTLGEWNYYLFKKTSEVIESEASDIVFEQYYDTVNYVNNHHAGTGQYIAKKGTQTLNVAAVHLSQDMYDFVRGITLSPIVDLYDNGNWKRVKIGDTDLSKSSRVLQHLEIEVILPDLINQSL